MVDPIGSYAGLSIQRPSGVGSIQGPATAKINRTGGTDFGPAYQVQLSAEAQAASATSSTAVTSRATSPLTPMPFSAHSTGATEKRFKINGAESHRRPYYQEHPAPRCGVFSFEDPLAFEPQDNFPRRLQIPALSRGVFHTHDRQSHANPRCREHTVPARSLENSPPLDPGDEIRMLFQKRVVGGQLHHMVGLPAAGTAGGAVKLSHPIEKLPCSLICPKTRGCLRR